ncbi:MAG: hypothetical protein AAGD04_07160 [Pseudomonadota bacterium]
MSDISVRPSRAVIDWHKAGWRTYLACIALSFFVMLEPAPTDLVFCIALGMMLLAPIQPVKLFGPFVTLGLILFLWFSVLSLFFVTDLFFAAYRAIVIEIYISLLFVLTAYFVKVSGDKAFRLILVMLFLGGLLTSLIGVLAYLDLIPQRQLFFRDDYLKRIRSTFKDPNVLGPYLVPSILAGIWIVLTSPKLRWMVGFATVLMIAALVITYSRGAWAHFIVSLSVFGCFMLVNRQTYFAAFVALIAVGCGGMLAAVYYSDALGAALGDSYFSRRLSFQSYDTKRFDLILRALFDMTGTPLGIGPYQSRVFYGWEPHNSFALLGLQNGLFALLGYVLICVGAIWRCATKVLAQEDGWFKYAFILSVLIGLMVVSQVVSSLHWRHLYVVLGLAFGDYKTNQFFEGRRIFS